MKRPSPALVISLLALFVALGGTGYAALKINGKNIINRSVPGTKLKKNSLGGTEIREGKLAKVRRAARANRADVAGNATQLGGRPAGSFASSRLYLHRYTEADRGEKVTIFEQGPFKVILDCSPAFGGGQDKAAAGIQIETSDQTRNSISTPGPDTLLPAGSTINTARTATGNIAGATFRLVGGYVDAGDGRTLDFSARLRVGTLGAIWCSAVTQATLGGN